MADKQNETISKESPKHEYLVSTFVQYMERTLALSQYIPDAVVELIINFSETPGAMIIINGSSTTQAGFSGDDAPITVFPTIVGTPRNNILIKNMKMKEYYVGDEVQAKRGILQVKYPVEYSMITDFTAIERLWRHIFDNELKTDPQGTNVLVAECPLNAKATRAKMTQIMFETFGVAGLYTIIGEVLALYAAGRTTGIVLSIGDGAGYSVPVYEGYSLPHGICRYNRAGSEITVFLMKYLSWRGYSFTTTAEREIVRDIKEKLCYVALDFEAEMIKYENDIDHSLEQLYELPDGQVIVIGNEMFRAPETLFTIDKWRDGIHGMLYRSFMRVDKDIRRTLYENIVLTGGTTMFKGFPERIEKEINGLKHPDFQLNVVAPVERKYSQWIGGSILTSLATFEEKWITKEEYDEFGPDIVHKKCSWFFILG